MDTRQRTRAAEIARSIAAARGLAVDDAIVLHDSNKLTLRLLPCDVVARVAPENQQNAAFEVDLAQRLIRAGCPVGALDARLGSHVHQRDDYVVTYWTYYPPSATGPVPAGDYAAALAELHRGMRAVELATPHVTDRVADAQQLLADRARTPALVDSDRIVLAGALHELQHSILDRGSAEQLLHGEPHPGNLLATASGPRFIDLETCCRGPVEFDLAHAPDEVSDHYPGLDADQLRDCRMLMLAMITTWRFDRDDQLPDGLQRGAAWLSELRAALRR